MNHQHQVAQNAGGNLGTKSEATKPAGKPRQHKQRRSKGKRRAGEGKAAKHFGTDAIEDTRRKEGEGSLVQNSGMLCSATDGVMATNRSSVPLMVRRTVCYPSSLRFTQLKLP